MPEQRKPFRFRLPWLAPQRTRASASENAPATSFPIQRPGGKAPAQPSPQQSQPPPKAEPQPKPSMPYPPKTSRSTTAKLPRPRATTAESPESASSPIPYLPPPPGVLLHYPEYSPPSNSPKSVATNNPPSPSRSVGESSKTTPQRQPSPEATSESRVGSSLPGSPSQGEPRSAVLSDASSESSTSSLPVAASSHATSQAEQESVKVSRPQSPSRLEPQKASEESQKELETIVGNVSQSISLPAKPQDQEGTKKTEPQAPLQESEPKVEIAPGNATENSTSQDDATTGERIEGSRLAKGLTSKEINTEPAPPQKAMEGESEGMVDKVTPGFGNNGVESQSTKKQQMQETSVIKETLSTTSYIGKQVKTVGPSQPAEGNASMSFQKPVEEVAPSHREIKEDISKLVRKLTTGPQVVVITLTGENKGASMLMSSEARKVAPIHIHRGYKTDPDESLESATDGETGTNGKKSLDDKPTPAATTYVNNNVQIINNSLVVEASVSGSNPGVHMLFFQSTSEAIKAKGKSELTEARKAEFTSTRAERLTHEPTVRRRCLRGLFQESSDSETENPNKTRRHGCRYSCGGKDKEYM